MSEQSPTLTLNEDEVRAVVRLLAEALTPDDGRPAKVVRLMEGLCEMVAADGWVWVRSRLDPELVEPINLDYLYSGISSNQMAALARRMLAVAGEGAEFAPLGERFNAQPPEPFTLTRRQLADDNAWADDPTMAPIREAGLDEVMYSWFPFPDGEGATVWSGVWFYRVPDSPAFDARAARIAHLLISECAPLHVDGLALTVEPTLHTLSARQRLVLTQLIDGKSIKQVAYDLGLSRHTVNDHVKAIYRHFDVQSRAELLRRFMVGDV